ncbi:MAG TPA: hypothetical protein PL070_20475 [Flavobacteriales bacterium]|nr:hypothetical protein [Flavobacteriales bacterium]
MKRFGQLQAMAFVSLATTLFSASCDRDDTKPTVNPTIEFVVAEGYTYLSDTVAMGDTLLVGVRINRGDDGLNTFKVISTYDGGNETVVDSLSIGSDTFAFDKSIRTRSQEGVERWTFWVRETDGDVIRRSLTFVVQ